MQWDDAYSIGIEEIDNQHKILFDYFRVLLDAARIGGRWAETHFPLMQLRDYAITHFGKEESLMRMSDYDETDKHIESHEKIIARLNELETASIQHKNICKDTAALIQHWLVAHIMHADRRYAQHFMNGGKIVVRDVFTGREA